MLQKFLRKELMDNVQKELKSNLPTVEEIEAELERSEALEEAEHIK